MKIASAQINVLIGDFDGNVGKILAVLEKARNLGADLVIFPELCVCGYPPRDFLEFADFIEKSAASVERIAKACTGIAAIVGAPSVNPAEKGKPLYNSAFFLEDGQVKDVVHKTLLPNYDVFDEYRYFEPNRLQPHLITFRGVKIGLTICEDLWNISDDPLYVRNPVEELMKLYPDILVNIAASPYSYNQPRDRKEILYKNAVKYKTPVFYVNHVGGQTELLFDGGSMVLGADGTIASLAAFFREDLVITDHEAVICKDYKPLPYPAGDPANDIAMIHDALVMGIRDYFDKLHFHKATVGLSGGIDSALTLVLAAEALGPGNVVPLLLPSRFSSEHSITDAVLLCNILGVTYKTIPIDEVFTSMESTLKPHFRDLPFDLTEENMQARIRAALLMAFSNKFGYILLNTSNKSEAAVGYGTLYGDMSGGLSVLGDIYKTQVYEMSRYINRNGEIIPENSITKPPSAELRPGQKDSDSLPDYSILDKILYQYIEHRQGPHDLIRMGFDEKIVRKVLKLVNTSEYKRYQTPPILRVSPKAFGTGRRLPIAAKYLS
jgi:NAD+ synthase (glutamine-hydrolysing)